jgi:hypothetical protein
MTLRRDCICAVFPVERKGQRVVLNIGISWSTICYRGVQRVKEVFHMDPCEFERVSEEKRIRANMEKSCWNSSRTHKLMETKKMFGIVYSVSQMAS